MLWSAFADEHVLPGGSGAAETARCPSETIVHATHVLFVICVHVIGVDVTATFVRPVPYTTVGCSDGT
ncbi:MAG TPA: hypothetical protein VM690_01470 [Gaiellaceae bacterium]|nr:hypothetical protein [Gaiellaceae bacterium]